MKGVSKHVKRYIRDFKFGVGVSGGAKAIMYSANGVLSKQHEEGSLIMLTIDFSNTSNMVGRANFLYEVRVRCSSIFLTTVDFSNTYIS